MVFGMSASQTSVHYVTYCCHSFRLLSPSFISPSTSPYKIGIGCRHPCTIVIRFHVCTVSSGGLTLLQHATWWTVDLFSAAPLTDQLYRLLFPKFILWVPFVSNRFDRHERVWKVPAMSSIRVDSYWHIVFVFRTYKWTHSPNWLPEPFACVPHVQPRNEMNSWFPDQKYSKQRKRYYFIMRIKVRQ